MKEYIEREKAFDAVFGQFCASSDETESALNAAIDEIKAIPAADVRPVPAGGIGEMSDGYHTFNGLYYQRMVLFAALVKAHKDKAWKSWRHEDGELCFGGGWFIVGIDTPQGSYTYHYEAKDFDLFDCEELPVAKHWDGHTEKDVTRLLSLDMPRWIPVTERLPEKNGRYLVRYKRDIVLDYTEVHDDEARIMRFFVGDGWRYPFLCQPELRKAEQQTVTHWMALPGLPVEENTNGK